MLGRNTFVHCVFVYVVHVVHVVPTLVGVCVRTVCWLLCLHWLWQHRWFSCSWCTCACCACCALVHLCMLCMLCIWCYLSIYLSICPCQMLDCKTHKVKSPQRLFVCFHVSISLSMLCYATAQSGIVCYALGTSLSTCSCAWRTFPRPLHRRPSTLGCCGRCQMHGAAPFCWQKG